MVIFNSYVSLPEGIMMSSIDMAMTGGIPLFSEC